MIETDCDEGLFLILNLLTKPNRNALHSIHHLTHNVQHWFVSKLFNGYLLFLFLRNLPCMHGSLLALDPKRMFIVDGDKCFYFWVSGYVFKTIHLIT